DRFQQRAGGVAGRARALRRGAGGEARRPPLRARRASVRGGAPAGRGEPGPGPRAGRDRARGGQSLRAPREGRRRLPGRVRSGERPRGLAGGRRGGRPGRGRERPHPAPVLLDRLADRRADRRDPGARGQRREGQRDGARGDQPAPPDLRRVRGAAAGAGRDPRAHGGRGGGGAGAAPRAGRAGAGEGGGGMSISASFIRRPVATTLVMLAVLLFGAVAYRSLPVSDLPNVDLPTLLVSASLPGASPETMASSVATPL